MRRAGRPGFSIIELLCVIAVVSVVLALLLPAFGRVRVEARRLGSLANIRQLGIMFQAYADGNDGLPPVFFHPIYGDPEESVQRIRHEGIERRGIWWSNAECFFFVFSPPAPPEVLLAPGSTPKRGAEYGGGRSAAVSDYALTQTLFAEPAYFTRTGQRGPSQWIPQRVSDIRYPSSKALMRQITVYEPSLQDPEYAAIGRPGEIVACCVTDILSAVLWGDLSGTNEVQGRLRPGVPNGYHLGVPPVPIDSPGMPIDETEWGIHGRDR